MDANEMKFKEYSKTLEIAEEIYLNLFGKPKTHLEWAESFNKIGQINRSILKTRL